MISSGILQDREPARLSTSKPSNILQLRTILIRERRGPFMLRSVLTIYSSLQATVEYEDVLIAEREDM